MIPGSYKLGPLEHIREGGWHLPYDQYPIESAVPCPAEAGNVLFFSYLTIPPTEKVHESRGQGMMLRGIDPIAVLRGVG